MSKRKNHAPAFKTKVALLALSGERPIVELSSVRRPLDADPPVGQAIQRIGHGHIFW